MLRIVRIIEGQCNLLLTFGYLRLPVALRLYQRIGSHQKNPKLNTKKKYYGSDQQAVTNQLRDPLLFHPNQPTSYVTVFYLIS